MDDLSANTTVIRKIETIVETACARESNIFGYGIWTHHIVPVVQHGRCLAKLSEADAEIVELAALLHDYASIKDRALYENHHLHSAEEAARLLADLGYPRERIERVRHCIAVHRGSVRTETRSPEGECLANCRRTCPHPECPFAPLPRLRSIRYGHR
jgi:uncharacterized protein